MAAPKPDYLSRDYDALRTSLLEYAKQAMPEWNPSSEGDFGMVMLELHAYMGDILSYYTDRAQFENYLPTATQRDSVLALAYLLGYVPNSGTPATGTLPLVTDRGALQVTIPAGTQFTTPRIDTLDGPVTVETSAEVTLPANPNGTNSAVNVAVTEGVSVAYVKIGESTGQPGQSFLLPNTGVYRDTIRIYVEDGTGTNIINPGTAQVVSREWTRKDHLLDAGESDAVFEAQITDDSMYVLFGDDVNGAIPATGLQIFASYRYGFGGSGNLPAGLVRFLNDRNLGQVHVERDANGSYLSSALLGGADPESTDSIRYNAPRVYRTQNRAVTVEDYKEIALGTEGVTKASVISGTFTSVTIYITGPDGGPPSETLKQMVANRFAGRTLAGVTVNVVAPTFVSVNFGSSANPIDVELLPQYSQKTAKAAIERAIRTYVTDLPFGEKLSVSQVYSAIMSVEGVRYVDIDVMARADSAQTGASKITPRVWEVFSPGSLYLNVTGGVV